MKNKFLARHAAMTLAMAVACGIPSVSVFAAEPANQSLGKEAMSVSSNFFHGIDRNQSTIKNKTTSLLEKKTGEVVEKGKTVYYDQFGLLASGKLNTKDGNYLFDENGQKVTGFVKEEGKTVYYDETTGRKVEEAAEIEKDGKTYLLDENGNTQTGWTDYEGKEYYLDADGSIVKGQTRDVDGVRYSFAENGQKEMSVTKDGYVYDENGKGKEDLSGYDKIAQAALAQIGVNQDCTMLVTNSLKTVGINFHGAPEAYLSLGPLTNNPVPGDICVYQGHVAIYIGNGQAVHGGWNGYTTAVYSVSCANPLIGYVHPVLP